MLLTIVWVLLLTFVAGPLLWMSLFYELAVRNVPALKELLAGGTVIILIALTTLLGFGLRRNWPASRGGWILLGSVLFGAVVCGALEVRRSRSASQDKVVISQAHMLSAAADQYYLENGGSTVELDQLVGRDHYIKAVQYVDHEVYPTRYAQGMTITVTGIAGLRTITYAP